MEENQKLGSVRIMKQQLNKGIKRGGRYFKSYKQQMEHDFRIEEMDSTYLKRPEEENKIHTWRSTKVEDIENDWEDLRNEFKKKHKKSMQKQTKETINFLISFSADFDLPEEERQRQYDIVRGWFEKKFDHPIYLIQHNDEKALHYTCSILNFDNETMRPLAKQIDTSKLQDEVFDYLKAHGVDYGHTRGVKKTISLSEHRSIMEAKVKELEAEIEAVRKEKEVAVIQRNEVFKQLEEFKGQNEEMRKRLKEVLSDFIQLGLSYKGKDAKGLMKLALRTWKGEEEKKIEAFVRKLEILIANDSGGNGTQGQGKGRTM